MPYKGLVSIKAGESALSTTQPHTEGIRRDTEKRASEAYSVGWGSL